MKAGRLGGRLFRKYVVVFLVLVGGVLLLSSVVELYFSYRETRNALARLERVPEFVRGMVRRAVEAHARRRGLAAVDARVVEEARATFRG